jgi:hypothetical protein
MSKQIFGLIAICFACLIFYYYPRWQKIHAEATIGWDVSGYYAYLPAVFIYGDLKQCMFLEKLRTKYRFTPSPMQGSRLENGNFVIKYSMGQALQFLPWFLVGHASAHLFGYETDGYSAPYQLAISVGSFLIMLLGLWYLRRILLQYYTDKVVVIVLLLVAFGTNYLNYATTDGAMTHNWLFACTAVIMFYTDRFYKAPSYRSAAIIGLLCGWAMLTRPTDALLAAIPALWGVYHWASATDRFQFVLAHWKKYAIAIGIAAAVASLQAIYWKYTSGHWIHYSYGEESFYWRNPSLYEVTFSYRCGWLPYTPLLAFAWLGLIWLFRQHRPQVLAIGSSMVMTLYVASAWSTWWYGGSLGMRAIVQYYPLYAFALAALVSSVLQYNRYVKVLLLCVASLGIYLNGWWYREAHSGKAFVSEQMTKQFFLQSVGRWSFEQEWIKLLDTKRIYTDSIKHAVTLIHQDFESDKVGQLSTLYPLVGNQSGFVDGAHQFSPEWKTASAQKSWYRASCVFAADPKEWDLWRGTQFQMAFYQGTKCIHQTGIRLHRFIEGGETKHIHFDVNASQLQYDSVSVRFWNAEGNKRLVFDDVQLIGFDALHE